MEVLYLRDRDKSLFTRYENALSDGACYADAWNSIWIRSVSDIPTIMINVSMRNIHCWINL